MKDALASLEAQGIGSDLEIIVQDADVEPDQGQSDALNKGFAKAKGEWLFWLNADDALLPGVLKKLSRKVREESAKFVCTPRIAPAFAARFARGIHSATSSPGAELHFARGASFDWIAGNTVYIDKDGKGLNARWNRRWHPFLYKHLSVWTGGPSAFFRRELFERTGGFDTSLKYVMDLDLWTRMARAGARYEVVDFPVWGFRWHEGSLTAGGQHEEETAAEFRSLCEKFGYGNRAFWRMMMRATQLLDGSWMRRRRESAVAKDANVATAVKQ